ncbi:MAG: hypothetical protein ACK4FG_00645 [Brevundimonas sp.]
MTDIARAPFPLWRIVLWTFIGGLLLLPAAAMRVTNDVDWTATDFVFAGLVLGLAGALFEIVMLTIRQPLHRVFASLLILGGVMAVWAAAVSDLI